MTTWTERSSPPTTFWVEHRRFFATEDAYDLFYVEQVGKAKGYVPLQDGDLFYLFKPNNGTTKFDIDSNFFRFVEAT